MKSYLVIYLRRAKYEDGEYTESRLYTEMDSVSQVIDQFRHSFQHQDDKLVAIVRVNLDSEPVKGMKVDLNDGDEILIITDVNSKFITFDDGTFISKTDWVSCVQDRIIKILDNHKHV